MEHRLAAIVATDIVGYSRLMGADEAATLAAMKAHRRELWSPVIERHGGRVVGTAGDSLLLEFASAIAAVESAIEIQEGMAAREAETSYDTRMQLRIGVNLGEVVADGDDIFGDGVNVAARLQTLAEPGGICISAKVHDEIAGKIRAGFTDAGAHEVKNIARPVHVWRWRAGAAPAGAGDPPLPLPEKPSIAVLPFDNMSNDPDQDFFADGMAEDIITALSRMPWFFVIARNSSFTYKGRAVDVTRVSAELGVRYVLEGSVRKAGQRLRITAQLIDATTGQHVWAERYDRDISDIFEVQDEVTRAIVGAVAPEFLSTEARRARAKDPAKLDAWECVMRGRAHLWKLAREDATAARRLFERAIELAPSGEFGTSDLALVHFLEAYYRWSDTPERALEEMLHTAERAVAADDGDPLALTILAWANTVSHRWDEALPPVERAIELSPNFAPAIGLRGAILALLGDAEPAIAAIEAAFRLSPRDGFQVFWLMGLFWALNALGRYDEAADVARRGIRAAPSNPTFRRQLGSSLALAGRIDEARTAVRDYLQLEPDHTLADAAKVPARNPEHLARFVDGLRQAGLPE